MEQINKKVKFFALIFIFICFNALSQTNKNNFCFLINPIVDSFIENLVHKEVNLNKNYLTIISIKDKDNNYNIDFSLTKGNLEALQITNPLNVKVKYGNIKILLSGKTKKDLKFLKKSIKKTKNIFNNSDLSKNYTGFYDEDYVWSSFFDNKKELINFYIPEEKESAYKIFDKLKNEIKISPTFKRLDCNCL